MRRERGAGAKVGLGLFDRALAQFEHTDIVEGLGVLRIDRDGHLVGLAGCRKQQRDTRDVRGIHEILDKKNNRLDGEARQQIIWQPNIYLIGQVEVANADCHLTDIVPHVGHVFVRRERQCLLKARQGHVVLRRVEAAETNIVPQFGVGNAHLARRQVVVTRNM